MLDDSHSNSSGPKDTTHNDESAGAKIWTVYISEAEKYDKALVDRWRSDMEGILIFAGLFSASLTAFLIESYRTLTPDQGQLSVLILAHISQQLSAGANSPAFELPAPNTVGSLPTATSLACNILWFISLCLSLSCALIATLVEQWARDFIQATEMRPSPITRARIFSYLYYGVQRFSMHSVVELIPLLLHTSLVFFFAGLVAFLHPVNAIITVLAATLLGVISLIYLTLTVLPIIYPNCPYRTPLSVVLWRVRQGFLNLLSKYSYTQPLVDTDEESSVTPCYQPPLDKSTMVEVMVRHATQKSAERDQRDHRALVWTVKSLADDEELEPFIEGISAVLWSTKGRRKLYDERIRALVFHPEALLASRIENFLRSCNGSLLLPGVEVRRQISSLKALWAIARLSLEEPRQRQPLESFDIVLLHALRRSSTSAVKRHVVPTLALVQYNIYCSVASGLRQILEAHIDSQDQKDHSTGTQHPLLRFSPALKKIERQMGRLRPSVWLLNPENINYFHIGEPPLFGSLGLKTDLPSNLWFFNQITDRLRFLEDAPHCIFLQFLEDSADVDSMPYEFLPTCSGIPLTAIPPSAVERTLERIISTHSDRLKKHPEVHHIDSVVGMLLSHWRPEAPSFDSAPWIVQYLTSRDSDDSLYQALHNSALEVLRSCITAYLQILDSDISTDNVLEAMWRLCVVSRRIQNTSVKGPPGAFDATALRAVQQAETSLYYPPVVALIQCDILNTMMQHRMETADEKALLMTKLRFGILPGKSPSLGDDPEFLALPREVGAVLNMRYTEAGFTIIADFLDGCTSTVLPYHVRETIQHITAFVPRTKIHASHQLRFASSLLDLVQANTTSAHSEMISKIIHSTIFTAYSRAYGRSHNQIKSYAATLPPGQFPTLVKRITTIISNIETPEFVDEPPKLQPPSSRRNFTHILGAGYQYRVSRP
ncbi:hypothetical protein DFH09DRAFT_1272236 [Mycena vulgaris]|nr:hypothetical protein DFH09DRAFT_1272236 [Mycena vulgaris]